MVSGECSVNGSEFDSALPLKHLLYLRGDHDFSRRKTALLEILVKSRLSIAFICCCYMKFWKRLGVDQG